ncbi:hypothetical protein RD792_006986 [Penstemon davidsonii]|uniref:Terpene synthase metal-binding domain-containing protein n=1 Tax=Penstemon davidsonii TaxID=160366 RepID=A0ABR0D563_9LAMI|nr:hypothetical protein RD792_006986 [Penstemon davidsonii]
MAKAKNSLATRVDDAFKLPIHKTLTIFAAKKFISQYQEDESHSKVLLKLAKTEFNKNQKMHQQELSEITRRTLSKVIAMASTIDDIYDVYGTLDELLLFTDAIQRWDVSALDQIPQYMRYCYQALLDVYAEAENELDKTGKSYCVNYAEEEQQLNSLVGMHMGDVKIKKDYFDWVSSEPLIVRATSTIARLMDDMAGYGFEQKKSAVHCYMNQNNNSSKEVTIDELEKQVSRAWKDINQECLDPMVVVSMPILMRIVNSALVIYLLYKDEDGYTNSNNSKIKDIIKSVLIEPVTL